MTSEPIPRGQQWRRPKDHHSSIIRDRWNINISVWLLYDAPRRGQARPVQANRLHWSFARVERDIINYNAITLPTDDHSTRLVHLVAPGASVRPFPPPEGHLDTPKGCALCAVFCCSPATVYHKWATSHHHPPITRSNACMHHNSTPYTEWYVRYKVMSIAGVPALCVWVFESWHYILIRANISHSSAADGHTMLLYYYPAHNMSSRSSRSWDSFTRPH